MRDRHALEAKLIIDILRLEGALGGPENCREELSPGGDPIAGINCWRGRLEAACLMAKS